MNVLRNKRGILPPEGCLLPGDKKQPQIAVASHNGGAHQETFRVKSGELEEFLSDIMRESWTLKAWFAYKIRDKDLKEKCHLEAKSPCWQQVWDLIEQEGEEWAALYERRKLARVHKAMWELHEPYSIVALWARTVAVLKYKIDARTDHSDANIRGLKWHDYFYEDEGKCFALYRFMLYQHRLFGLGRVNSIHPPVNDGRARSWQNSHGFKIRKATKKFMKDTGWDPLGMLSTALRRELTVPHNRRASDKTITFVHTQDRRLRVHKRSLASIRQQEGQGLHKALSNVLKVKTKKAFTGDRNLPIESFEKLLTHIDSTIDPVVWLCNDSKPPTLPAPTPVEARPQRDYSNHAILKLEHLVESLSGKDHVRSARARFGLLQENHPHSKDFVKDLKVYFAPLEQATIAEWQKLSERQRLCEDAMGDPTYFEKLHELTTELGAEQQAHAQQYFALVNTSNPLASLAAENLIKLLLPDDVDWQFVKARKNLFDEIKSET